MLITLRPTQETIDIVAALKGRWHGSYAMCVCPAHADRTPSLSVRQGERGILVHCFAGCRSEDVLRAIGRTKPILNSPSPSYRPEGTAPNVRRIWDQATEIRGTLGEVYLRSRRLPIDLPDLRFHPRCPFGRKPKTTFRPAILVGVRTGHRMTAIQRIRLTNDGTWHDGNSCSESLNGARGHRSSRATCSPLLRAWRMRRAILRSKESLAGQHSGISVSR